MKAGLIGLLCVCPQACGRMVARDNGSDDTEGVFLATRVRRRGARRLHSNGKPMRLGGGGLGGGNPSQGPGHTSQSINQTQSKAQRANTRIHQPRTSIPRPPVDGAR